MMKTIVLMRHAETESIFGASTDFERQLTTSGRSEILQTAQFMANRGPDCQKIFHSSARRTTQTAQIMANALQMNNSALSASKVLYGASVANWFSFINAIDDSLNTVLLIGHNPSISFLVDYFTQYGNVSFSPGHAACISFPFDKWEMVTGKSGELEWVFDKI